MARGKARRPAVTSGGSNPYDELVRVFSDMMDDKIATLMPRLGTVKGKDGRRVRVQPFGEDGASNESHARDGGKNARDDDTVVLLPIGGGNYVALGPIVGNNDGGRDDLISGKEIETDAIEERHIKKNAIKGNHLANNSIGDRELGRGFINRSMLQDSFANTLADAGHIGRIDKRIDGQKSRIDNLMQRMNKQDGGGQN